MHYTLLNTIICCLLLLTGTACLSQNNRTYIHGRIHANDPAYTLSLRNGDSLVSVPVDSLEGRFSTEVVCDRPKIVTLWGVIGKGEDKWPFSRSVFISPGKDLKMFLHATDRQMTLTFDVQDRNNDALNEYEQFYQSHIRTLWVSTPTAKEAPNFLKAFHTQAEAIIAGYEPGPEIREYLTIYGYLGYLESIQNLRFLYRRDTTNRLAEGLEKAVPSPEKILDNPTALLFSGTIPRINNYLSKQTPTPEEQIRLLKEKFTQPEIIKEVIIYILQDFLSAYDYTQNFDEGLARFEKMCAFLPGRGDELVSEFRSRKFSVEGAPLPEATLEDREGKSCKLSDFKGKYLYIDLWASWCVPCCAEIPHLKKLEKEIKNKEVEFISISIDTNKDNWKMRMKQLQMEGHQFIATGKELTAMLNVRGIPHFLLYDKEGRLMQYKAPQPSAGDPLKQLLNGLK